MCITEISIDPNNSSEWPNMNCGREDPAAHRHAPMECLVITCVQTYSSAVVMIHPLIGIMPVMNR